MKSLLLSADVFEVTNETTGEVLKGCTLFYLNKYRDPSGKSLGLKPTKITASIDVFKKITQSSIELPALADMEIGSKPGAQNKASLVLFDLELIESVQLF